MRVTVVGIGADGWSGLSESARAIVRDADVLMGGARHLDLVPEVPAQRRERWPSPLREGLPALLADLDGSVVALASGDPLVAGIASTLIELLGAEAVEVVPAVSSVALARARLGWPAETVTVLRDHRELPRYLADGVRLIVLSADATTPGRVAALLRDRGFGPSRLVVLGDLGAGAESRTETTAAAGLTGEAPALNVVAVEALGEPGLGLAPGLPDEAFEHDGQLTRRDLRASALARLAPTPAALLWDVGAGAGSVAIEWMRSDLSCRAIAIEADERRAARIGRNAERLGAPRLRVVQGRAPEALDGLEAPDAVFIGGGASQPGVVETSLAALRPGGRLVVHGVTVQTETLLAGLHAEHGGELTRIAVEYAAPLGSYTGWTPARTVTQWAVRR